MIKLILPIIFGLLSAASALACGPGNIVELNDIKHLSVSAIVNTETGERFYYSDDLAMGDNDINIIDSKGSFTHKIFLVAEEDFIRVVVLDYANGERTHYKGLSKDKLSRGCNELERI